MTNYREILRLKSLGLKNSQIAEALQCSRTTVVKTLKAASVAGLTYPLPENLSDKGLNQLLFPSSNGKTGFKMPDYEYISKEMQRRGVTLTLLWLEYVDECKASGEIPYQSTQFYKYYNEFQAKQNASMHLSHKPGEIMQVDWAGDTASLTDQDTGEIIPVYLFVCALPFSGYTYVEACRNMDESSWITAHVHAFSFFGGTPRIIQCDNLKTGVISHGRDEIVLNRNYQEMAEYYNLAVIPCRVRAPKDKAVVEGTVGVMSTWIIAALRNRCFFSVSELNEAIEEKLYDFNHKPFQKKDGSRASLFENEKSFLMPLPAKAYEASFWKVATVAPNYHVSIDKMNYSVPFEYIKRKVDVRLTKDTVEIFFEGNRICSHHRLYGRNGQYSTTESHMPENHQKYVQWNGDRFRNWASKIGPNTEKTVSAILSSYKVAQQGYKACLGLLKLADKYSSERLENACLKALGYTPRPNLKYVRTILLSGQDKVEITPAAEDPSAKFGFLRGAEYFERGNA